MHVILGGAYNGKAKWVRNKYELKGKEYIWITAYKKEPFPVSLEKYDTSLLVLEGVEQWIRQVSSVKNAIYSRDEGRDVIKNWKYWEQQSGRKLVVIGNDISKGIVPMEKADRVWRDAAGWFFQDLVQECDQFDVIWYGINYPLKGGISNENLYENW
jgi:adenosyl cobinamide kinase/adenosyl cobinamide phosphate guanylyltransferase